MSNSSSCRVALLVFLVGAIMATLGFATGFATHAVLVAAEPLASSIAFVDDTSTPRPTEALSSPEAEGDASAPATGTDPLPTAVEPTPEPTPVPTVVIPPETGETFDLFWEAWEIIQQDFYGDLPTEEEMTFAAIRGATNALDDPYTAFVEPAAAEHRRATEGSSYEGIGAMVTMENGRFTIVEPFKGQPADRAGLRPGDVVLQVDDTPIGDMSLYEAIGLILGPAGTEVRMTIQREGEEPFEVTIVRAKIDIPLVESEMRPDGIAYVSLTQFNAEAGDKLSIAIEELLEQNPKGLIFDLRGNPGGFLHEAMLVSGLFIPKDQLAMIERSKDGEQRLTPAEFGSGGPVAPDIPMVVLVNGGSASASEIVAGALQDHERAVLIGEQTFGKGSVQLLHELSNGAELRVTKARWFTPNNRAIHGEGLEPDIIVEITEEDAEAELDSQLDRAVEYLLAGE